MSLPLAGRIAHCLDNWKQITTDPWIDPLGTSGVPYRVEAHPATTSVTSKEAALPVEEEVDGLLQKGVVVVVPPLADQFISRLFLV